MSVLEVFSAGGAGLANARPVLIPLMNSEEKKSPRARKVNPKYAGVEHIRRLFYPEESKVAPALPGTKIQAMDESVKRERKSSIAIQDKKEERSGKRAMSISLEANRKASRTTGMQEPVSTSTTLPLAAYVEQSKDNRLSSPEESALTHEEVQFKDMRGGGTGSLGPLVRECFQTVLKDVNGGNSVLRPTASRRMCSLYVFGTNPEKEMKVDVNQDLMCHE